MSHEPSQAGNTRFLGAIVVLLISTVICDFSHAAPLPGVSPKATGRAGDAWSDNNLKMQLLWCPPGTFNMGTSRELVLKYVGSIAGQNVLIPPDEAQVKVTLTTGFWMGKYEVTQEQWTELMGNNPSHFVGKTSPVDSVNWDDAHRFCAKLTKIEQEAGRVPQGFEYRLPTEAEWEYACRAGTTGYTFLGDLLGRNAGDRLDDYAWHGTNSGDAIPSNLHLPHTRGTHPVGQKKPNPWGFHDIVGNLIEWNLDWYSGNLPGGTDPLQTQKTPFRSVRGSYYLGSRATCRSAMRGRRSPNSRAQNLGFRVVLGPIREFPKLKQEPFVLKKNIKRRSDNSLKMEVIWCPAGKFKMGTTKELAGQVIGNILGAVARVHWDEAEVDVTLSSGFWMGKLEVTQEQWLKLMPENPSKFVGKTLPVHNLTWEEATDFCNKLTELESDEGRLTPGWEYRLPTEAEWEYACRAGTTDYFFLGNLRDAESYLDDYAWHAEIVRQPQPVGQKKPNPWGFCDIQGNVSEWTQDWHSPQLPGGTDPLQTKPSKFRVARGGYYNSPRATCRSAMRGTRDAGVRSAATGLRIVLAPIREK